MNRHTTQIKRFALTFTLITLYSISGSLMAADASSGNKKDGLVATVNGEKITASMLKQYQRSRGFVENVAKKQQIQLMIEELINRELIYQDAVKNGVDKSPAVVKQVKLLQKNIVAGAMLKNVTEVGQISDDQLKKEYEKRKKDLATKEYKASHILLEDEKLAKKIIAQLDKGAKFAVLAKEKSTGPSATKGGDLGWFKPKEMVKPFSAAVAKLKDNEYTKKPIKSDFGWHVILRVKSREVAAPSFDQMKGQLKIRVQNLQVEQYIGSLRQKAKIKRTHKPK
jgi:peptidyl-prolyl cis-trans isomerase C